MSYRFDATKCMAVIAAWPDIYVSPQLIAWLHAIGVTDILVHRIGRGRVECGYNAGIEIALESKSSQFIFADRDMWPSIETAAPFLGARHDAVGCVCDTGIDESWDDPQVFHTGLWRTRRKVLERVGIAPFAWHLNERGTGATTCMCWPFIRRVHAAGFTTGHAGFARHTLKSITPEPLVMKLEPPS